VEGETEEKKSPPNSKEQGSWLTGQGESGKREVEEGAGESEAGLLQRSPEGAPGARPYEKKIPREGKKKKGEKKGDGRERVPPSFPWVVTKAAPKEGGRCKERGEIEGYFRC